MTAGQIDRMIYEQIHVHKQVDRYRDRKKMQTDSLEDRQTDRKIDR